MTERRWFRCSLESGLPLTHISAAFGSVADQFRMRFSTTLFRVSSFPIDRASESESTCVAPSRYAAVESAPSRTSPVNVSIQREASGQLVSTQWLAIVVTTFVCSFADSVASQFAADEGSFAAPQRRNC